MMQRKIKLIGWGNALAKGKQVFDGQIRYRLTNGETLLDLAGQAAVKALQTAGKKIEDIDCIVGGMATPLQAIPCNAVLIHERLAKGLEIPAMDINTTCTSFISALDVISYLIAMKRYRTVLIVSGDTASAALNPDQKESYELFSDGASAFVVTLAEEEEYSELVYSAQRTWSEGAHDTEIRGGGGLMPSFAMGEENREDYYFDMKGSRILKLTAKKLPDFVEQSLQAARVRREEIRWVIPHQASRALDVIMPRLGFAKGTYINRVAEYGNMISASVPYALCQGLEEGRIKQGDMVLLMGTAAGLTANFMLLRL